MKTWIPIALAACLLGCNAEDAGDLKRDAGALAKTTGRAATNAQLVARINLALAQTKTVDMSGLHIEAKEGVVTVGGRVRDSTAQNKVLQVVESVRGVEKVVDDLRIAR
ncbi:MAG: BON domain-containing protein [Fimbriimonas sp.]